jgi:hypothetical protein
LQDVAEIIAGRGCIWRSSDADAGRRSELYRGSEKIEPHRPDDLEMAEAFPGTAPGWLAAGTPSWSEAECNHHNCKPTFWRASRRKLESMLTGTQSIQELLHWFATAAERKSVEPLAAQLVPGSLRRMHQSLRHVVADAAWG